MKKVLLTILTVILVAGVLAGTGYAGYRIGYRQAAVTTTSGNAAPSFRHDFQFGPQNMPMHNFGGKFDHNFNRGMGPGNFGIMDRGGRFGFFSPMMFIGRILFWALVILFVYWLFTRSGWQLTRKQQPVEAAKTEAFEPEKKSE